ncbi:hypothetical protein LX32DRAFT_333630 [Colletotrichum zoysiae]|uniref:Uncharacterized protein n=1 Tax=Colletotrichum zoysiae TaxID=1216348 RepID=A0AAD9HKX8_9PEZI|nr:hypothetical protein LX32DRAFT_333630 [Colletotrichum zoysiae]
MHQQALRSAGSRIKPDVVAVKTCIRTFSTTQLRAADEPSSDNKGNGGAAPSKRGALSTGLQRSRAAASEIGQLLRSGPRSGRASNSANNAGAAAANPKVIDIKTLPNRGGINFVKVPQGFRRGGTSNDANNVGAAAKPNVIDIKSLSNRGGFGGTNFVKPPQGFGRGGRGLPSGFSSGGPSRARARGGGARGRGGRGGRGGRKPRREGEDGVSEADRKADRASAFERFFRPETAEEHTYVRARDQGFLPEAFTPSMSIEGLLGFAPSMPIASASSAIAAPAAVMRSLREAAGGQHYTPDHWTDTQRKETELVFRGNGTYFFSDLAERDKFLGDLRAASEDVRAAPKDDAATSAKVKAMLAAKVEAGASQAVREYIVDRVVKGRHVTPRFVEQGSRDPVSMARESHLVNETYSPVDGRKFDGKIAALVSKGKPAAGGKTATA